VTIVVSPAVVLHTLCRWKHTVTQTSPCLIRDQWTTSEQLLSRVYAGELLLLSSLSLLLSLLLRLLLGNIHNSSKQAVANDTVTCRHRSAGSLRLVPKLLKTPHEIIVTLNLNNNAEST